MGYRYVVYEKEGNIARVILNKPEKLNAFTLLGGEDAKELWAAFDEAAEDDDVKVVILKGKGRAFQVGHDLTTVGFVYGMGTGQPGERHASQRIRLKVDRWAMEKSMGLFLHPKITIAQVHGYCLAGGAYFALACDLAVAAEDAQIGFTEERMGSAGMNGPITLLFLTVGLKKALDLLLTGRIISGKEAAEIGLVTKAVPADKLEEETEKLAKAMTLLPRDGIAIGKATRHLIYERLGLTNAFITGYVSHTLFTNLRWEPDEYNFFKERRDKGAKASFHERDERYAGLV